MTPHFRHQRPHNQPTNASNLCIPRRSWTIYQAIPPEDAADAYAAAQVMQAAVKAVGSIDDQLKLADWLRGHTVDTILGPLSCGRHGCPAE